MPPAAKKRKTGATTSRQLTAPATQRDIQAFGKISKPQSRSHAKGTLEKEGYVEERGGKSIISEEIGKKAKEESTVASAKERDVQSEFTANGQELSTNSESKSIRASAGDAASQKILRIVAKPVTPRKKGLPKQKETETPTKGARFLLETLALPSSSPSSPSSSAGKSQDETLPSSPVSARSIALPYDASQELPDELQDLINLHSSFLTALSLHYAHNGSMTPADLRNLCPGVERAWRKRRVTIDDVQRILALEGDDQKRHQETCPLYLSDYGHGKICVEITDSYLSRSTHRQPVNEKILNARFLQNLEQQWNAHKITQNASPSVFISSLPLKPIRACASLSKLHPLLSKGQRRLEDLKAGAIRAQQTPLKTISVNVTSLPHQRAKQTTIRSTDLFSRLKAKQLHQSTLPLPPSSESLARKSALQRLPEIAPVLGSLAGSSKKHCNDDACAEATKPRMTHASFTMPMLVQHLQMSLSNPVGKEEAIRCVRLLAEVVPEWVGVREVGKLVGVTVRGEAIGREELRKRIETLI